MREERIKMELIEKTFCDEMEVAIWANLDSPQARIIIDVGKKGICEAEFTKEDLSALDECKNKRDSHSTYRRLMRTGALMLLHKIIIDRDY
ncbi:hypothetical protein ES703_27694 [subsurface metagenome]